MFLLLLLPLLFIIVSVIRFDTVVVVFFGADGFVVAVTPSYYYLT